MRVSPHVSDPMPQVYSGSGCPQTRIPKPLKKGGGIPYLEKQMIKVLGSKEGNVDIFKLKKKSSYALYWK